MVFCRWYPLLIPWIAIDGTDREAVCPAGDLYSGISVNPTCVLHRGYAYYAGSRHSVVVDGRAKSSVTVNAQPLSGGDGFTILDKVIDGQGANCLVKPVGNDLYVMLYYFDYEDKENQDGLFTAIELYRWDSKTRQVEFLYSMTGASDGSNFDRMSFQPVPGDGIYLQGYYRTRPVEDDQGFYASIRQCVYKYCFETGEMVELQGFDSGGDQLYQAPLYTEDHIVVRSAVHLSDGGFERTLYVYVYDYDGIPVLGVGMGEHGFGVFMGVDDAFLYFYCIENDDSQHYIAIPLDGGEIIEIR